eukprot:EC792874.1.p1 GENE.EC792874.1~~EC792874.1.p1  ORF type:complete len:123 (+),score=18.10 EC792874.1:2-370(+)
MANSCDNCLRVWNMHDGQVVREYRDHTNPRFDNRPMVVNFEYSSDQRMLLVPSAGGAVCAYRDGVDGEEAIFVNTPQRAHRETEILRIATASSKLAFTTDFCMATSNSSHNIQLWGTRGETV